MSHANHNDSAFVNNAFHASSSISQTDALPTTTPQDTAPHSTTPATKTPISNIIINRPSFNQPSYKEFAVYNKPKIALRTRIQGKLRSNLACNSACLRSKVLAFLPFISIFRTYKLSDFFSDFIAGLTVGIINIPQGMAYGMLANIPPVYGLYTSFFPAIVYFFFGTSRHISMGTFALVSLMVGVVVDKADCEHNATGNDTTDIITALSSTVDPVVQCKVDIGVATAFMGGIFQIIFALLRVDLLTEYLSGPLTRALTTGAAFHIFTSQLRHVFGFSLGSYPGFFKLIKRYIHFFTSIKRTNVPSLVTAILCILILYLNKRFVNPLVKQYIKMPFPLEFIMLIVMTGLSYAFDFSSAAVFNMTVIGDIPRGFPVPSIPKFSLLSSVAADSFTIAIVAFILSFSIAKLFAEIEQYSIDSKQELYAYGLSAIASSFFSCFMPAASLSRSNVMYYGGAKTQLTALVSCLLLLVVILAVGPLFYYLPNTVLAAIIIINLHSTFLQFSDLSYLFKLSIFDAMTWVITCGMVLLSDIDIGLGIGVAFSLYTVVLRTQRPKMQRLGNVAGTELYEDTKYFAMSREVEGIKIVRLTGSLYYANRSYFSEQLDYSKVLPASDFEKVLNRKSSSQIVGAEDELESGLSLGALHTTDVILDCTLISFVDADGIKALNKAIKSYREIQVTVHLASCNDKVSTCVHKAQELDKLQTTEVYVTVHDAVTSIRGSLVTSF